MALIPRFWRFVGWALMVPPHFHYNEKSPEVPEGFSGTVCLSLF
jgi:hypothetical protein